MIDPKKVQELTKDLDDVLGNLDAVRGKKFANAVAAYFESRQIIEIMSILAGMASESDAEHAKMLSRAGISVLSSITRKSLIELSDADVAEVIKTGDSLLERRERVVSGG